MDCGLVQQAIRRCEVIRSADRELLNRPGLGRAVRKYKCGTPGREPMYIPIERSLVFPIDPYRSPVPVCHTGMTNTPMPYLNVVSVLAGRFLQYRYMYSPNRSYSVVARSTTCVDLVLEYLSTS